MEEGVGAISQDRQWMYRRFIDGSLSQEFLDGLDTFVEFASSQLAFKDEEKIRCPCRKCDNIPYQPTSTVILHLGMYGFIPNYYTWRFQGEGSANRERNLVDDHNVEEEHNAKKDEPTEANGSGTLIVVDKGWSIWQKYAAYQDGVEFSPVWRYLSKLMELEDEWSCNQLADFREKIRVRIEKMSQPLPGSTEPQEIDAEKIFDDVFREISEDTKVRVFECQAAYNAGVVPMITREWMYRRFGEDGLINLDYFVGLEIFTEFATSQPAFMDGEKIKCPCRRCDNKRYQRPCTTKLHLGVFGFVPDYYVWRFQGEGCRTNENYSSDDEEVEEEHEVDGKEELALPKVDSELDEYWAYSRILYCEDDQEWCRDELERMREEIRVRVAERIRPLPGTTELLQEIDLSEIYLEVYEGVSEEMKARVFYGPGQSEDYYSSDDGGSSGDSTPISSDSTVSVDQSTRTLEENTESVEHKTMTPPTNTSSSSSQTSQLEGRIRELEARLKEKEEEYARFLEEQARRYVERDRELKDLKSQMVQFMSVLKNMYPGFAGLGESLP